jgi:hypothetical protein
MGYRDPDFEFAQVGRLLRDDYFALAPDVRYCPSCHTFHSVKQIGLIPVVTCPKVPRDQVRMVDGAGRTVGTIEDLG